MEAQKQQLKKVNNLLEELGENSVERDYMDNALTFNITLLQNEKEEIEREIQYFEIDKQQWYEEQMDTSNNTIELFDFQTLQNEFLSLKEEVQSLKNIQSDITNQQNSKNTNLVNYKSYLHDTKTITQLTIKINTEVLNKFYLNCAPYKIQDGMGQAFFDFILKMNPHAFEN